MLARIEKRPAPDFMFDFEAFKEFFDQMRSQKGST